MGVTDLMDDLLPCGHYISRPVYAYCRTADRVVVARYECDICRPSEQDPANHTAE